MNEIKFTPTNTILFILAILFLIFSINRGLKTADAEQAERKSKFMNMSIDKLGEYIVSKNSYVNHIDSITSIRPINYKNKTLLISYDVKKGFLQTIIGKIEDIESTKKRVNKDLISENCFKTSHSSFLDKDGVIQYSYYLTEGKNSEFIFSFEIKKEDCLKDTKKG